MTDFLYIQRSARSDICPDILSENLLQLALLMNGCFYSREEPVDIANRDGYSNGPYQDGRYTYRVTMCLPVNLLSEWDDIITVEQRIYRDILDQRRGEVEVRTLRLAELRNNTVYNSMCVPNDRIKELLQYTVIFGGPVWSDTINLKKIWIGNMVSDETRNSVEGNSFCERTQQKVER